jgi:hypothetical protein
LHFHDHEKGQHDPEEEVKQIFSLERYAHTAIKLGNLRLPFKIPNAALAGQTGISSGFNGKKYSYITKPAIRHKTFLMAVISLNFI